jgi:6,7-dimethyl-8-ribityllumazine synthase
MKFVFVVAEWNNEITEALYKGAYTTLIKHGAKEVIILKKYVPGTFELTLGAQLIAKNTDVDAVIVLGCVIQGETRHFDFICQGVAYGITELNIACNLPVIFGVLTTDNQQQALDRAGGKHGNKGDEAAYTAIKMVALKQSLEKTI